MRPSDPRQLPAAALCAGRSIIASARLDGPKGLDTSLAHRDAAAVQVHGRTAVSWDDLDAIADADRRVLAVDVGVFFGQTGELVLRPALDDRHAEVLGDRLATGVQDVPCGPSAN